MSRTKKIIFTIVVLIVIIIGAIIVGLKGFNVALYLREHDTLEYIFDTTYDKSDVKEIASDVFGSKKYEVRPVEVFDDAVYIIADSITDEEEELLLQKLSVLYVDESESDDEIEEELDTDESETVVEEEIEEEVLDTDVALDIDEEEEEKEEEESIYDLLALGTDYNVYHDSNIKLMDITKPYIAPTIIVAIIILICMMIRYRLIKSKNILLKTIDVAFRSLLLGLFLLSVVAICRIPFNIWVIPAIMFIVIIYMVIIFEIETRKKNNEETD